MKFKALFKMNIKRLNTFSKRVHITQGAFHRPKEDQKAAFYLLQLTWAKFKMLDLIGYDLTSECPTMLGMTFLTVRGS